MKNKLLGNKDKFNNIIISLIIGVVLAIVIYYSTKKLLLSLTMPLVSYGLYTFVNPLFNSSEQKKKYKNSYKDYILFYRSFEMFSTLENDYLTGIRKAIESMPISPLKESLEEYLENNKSLDEALNFTTSRSEASLIDEVKRCLLNGHDYFSLDPYLKTKIDKYEEEIKYKTSTTDLTIIAALLFISYIVIMVVSLYASKS